MLFASQTFGPVLQLLQSAMKGGPAKQKEGKPVVAPAVKSSRCAARHCACSGVHQPSKSLTPAGRWHRYKGVQEQQFWQERLGTRDVDELGIDTNASFLAAPAVPLPAPETLPPAAVVAQPKQQVPQQQASQRQPPVERGAEKKGGVPIIIVPSGCVRLWNMAG